MNHDGGLASGGERQLQRAHGDASLFAARGVGNREVVVAGLEVARETFLEHNEFRRLGSGIRGPLRGNLARENGVAGKDQDGRAIWAHGHFLASLDWSAAALRSGYHR